MAKQRTNVSFQLPERYWTALLEDAKQRGEKSHHQRARQMVIDALENSAFLELEEGLTTLLQKSSNVERMLCRLAYSVIVHAGGREPEEANEWIRKHLSEESR